MSALRTQQVPSAAPNREAIPPLIAGDHLTRAEFERRYRAMPGVKKAELIEGVVYMPSPVSRSHGDPHANVVLWLNFFAAHTPGTRCGDNSTLRLDQLNEPQPDAHLRIVQNLGGQVKVDADDFLAGPPELVAEVSLSSVSIDMHSKLQVYRRHGVREYVVWRVADGVIDWFFLNEGRFDPLPKTDGFYKSLVFPGLWLDDQATLAGDLPKVLATLQQGVAAPEHAEFVAQLAAADKAK